MEPIKKTQGQYSVFGGRNFYGQLELSQNILKMDITEYKKGGIFSCQLTNQNIQQNFRQFLIFRNVDDLLSELIQNKHLEINDENSLIIPIEVTYKQRNFQLKIQIPFTPKKFKSEEQKCKNLFAQIQQLQKKPNIEQNLIRFRVDETNQQYKILDLSNNRRIVTKIGQEKQHTTVNHKSVLPSKGIFNFKTKIMYTKNKYIFLGICGKEIKSNINSLGYHSPYFLGLYLCNGYLYGNGKNPSVAPSINCLSGKSIYRIQVNMNKNIITWYQDNAFLYSTEIPSTITNMGIYPIINLYDNGDTVELLYH